jgi:predicted RNA binding protein YcfA (HicA-like mRNA interferase family)
MSKLPPISGKKLARALERGGFVSRRQTGSHLLLEHSDGRIAIVPIHGGKDLPKGTLRGILRDSEITPNELSKLI